LKGGGQATWTWWYEIVQFFLKYGIIFSEQFALEHL